MPLPRPPPRRHSPAASAAAVAWRYPRRAGGASGPVAEAVEDGRRARRLLRAWSSGAARSRRGDRARAHHRARRGDHRRRGDRRAGVPRAPSGTLRSTSTPAPRAGASSTRRTFTTRGCTLITDLGDGTRRDVLGDRRSCVVESSARRAGSWSRSSLAVTLGNQRHHDRGEGPRRSRAADAEPDRRRRSGRRSRAATRRRRRRSTPRRAHARPAPRPGARALLLAAAAVAMAVAVREPRAARRALGVRRVAGLVARLGLVRALRDRLRRPAAALRCAGRAGRATRPERATRRRAGQV